MKKLLAKTAKKILADEKRRRKRGLPFSKLSEEAKEEARNWWREGEDWSDLGDLLETDLKDHFGITDCKLYFSLGHCQGDGVAFEGTPDLDEWRKHDEELDRQLKQLEGYAGMMRFEVPSLSVGIHCEGRYYHCNTMEVLLDWSNCEWDSEWYGQEPKEHWHRHIDALFEELRVYLSDRIKEIAKELEKTGYAEIEYKESDEYIDENIEANDYRFTKEGEIL